ncbi:MAG: hypothetical protein K2H73_10290, partial [Treponemataceae bacterium]|nr:hypothetical protein [Treponemataceae bacterium]
MKKTAMLFAAVLTAAFLFVGVGCSSIKQVATDSTANQWYKYNGSVTATASAASGLANFSDMYIYYNSRTETLRVVATSSAAIASLFYISYDKEGISNEKWLAGAVALHSKVPPASDPT